MPLYSIGLTADSLEFEFEDGSATGSSLDFGIHDNILLDSTDGAPGSNAGFRLALEEQSEKKPSYLTPDEKTRCFANNQGWWLRHYKSSSSPADGQQTSDRFWDELLVAVGNIAGTNSTTGLGVATISSLSFEGLTSGAANNAPAYEVGGSGTLANAFVRVVWNEPVDFELSTTDLPELTVTHTKSSDGTEVSYTATAPAGNTTVFTMESIGTDNDTILLNSTDGAPETDAGGRIMMEGDTPADASSDGNPDFLRMETQRSGTTMNFYFTIAGSNANGTLSIARQSFASLGSSTIKDLGLSTVTSSTDITQQVSDEVTSASVTTT